MTRITRNCWWPLALALCLLGAGCASAGSSDQAVMDALERQPLAARAWSYGQVPGTQVRTAHYSLYTTVRDGLFQRMLAATLEAAYARASALAPSTTMPATLNCYVFGDRPQWELYTRLQAGSNAPVYLQITAGGYCQDGVFAGYDIGRMQTLSVVAHEAWHQYSWFAFKDRLPSWLEEGLATQNEALEFDSVRPSFVPTQNYRRWLALKHAQRDRRLWKLRDLTSTHAGRVVKLAQENVDAYYAQLWALVLFLEHSPYHSGLDQLVQAARAGTLHEALAGTGVSAADIRASTERWNMVAGPRYLQAYIAPDTNKLEREYVAFMRKLTEQWPPVLDQ